MIIHQIRNATVLIEMGDIRLLVDPMLADKGALPPLRVFKYRGRNPSVRLPDDAMALMETATHCIITHCQRGHFDHLDGAAIKWLRDGAVPVFCTPRDSDFLTSKGLKTVRLARDDKQRQPFLGGQIQTTPCRHGRGFVGRFMEHGVGYFLEMPNEPSLYLTGDTILTTDVRTLVQTKLPEIVIAPAGGARFDIGSEIIMNQHDLVSMAKLTPGIIIANHLEAISHCPVSRRDVSIVAQAAGLQDRIFAPLDGERIALP